MNKPWIEPKDKNEGYKKDEKVIHYNQVWRSVVDNNITEPGQGFWMVINVNHFEKE